MALSTDELSEIDTLLSSPEAASQAFTELRRRFPHLSLTRCDASDVVESPFRAYPVFDVHLLDAKDHCVQITTDPARATGIILAKRGA